MVGALGCAWHAFLNACRGNNLNAFFPLEWVSVPSCGHVRAFSFPGTSGLKSQKNEGPVGLGERFKQRTWNCAHATTASSSYCATTHPQKCIAVFLTALLFQSRLCELPPLPLYRCIVHQRSVSARLSLLLKRATWRLIFSISPVDFLKCE